MHYATPSKALILAKALGVLPPNVFIVGCQPVDADELGIGLSEPVEHAAQATIREIERIIQEIGSGESTT
jgi:hydrogenase maturation protease